MVSDPAVTAEALYLALALPVLLIGIVAVADAITWRLGGWGQR